MASGKIDEATDQMFHKRKCRFDPEDMFAALGEGW